MTSTAHSDTITLCPRCRAPTTLSLTWAAPGEVMTDRALDTEGGIELRYRVVTLTGGSGGAEAELFGRCSTNRGAVDLTCRSQSEFNPPELACLELLHTLSNL